MFQLTDNRFITDLEYDLNQLTPSISADTMKAHYNGHYLRYCDNLATLIVDTSYEAMNIEDIIHNSLRERSNPIYHNAAQIYNHDFYFAQFGKEKLDSVTGEFSNAIDNDFGSMEELKSTFTQKALTLFGSGWVWLVLEQHRQWDAPKLSIMTTTDADTFIPQDIDEHFIAPLMVCDMWEHSYYLDHTHHRDAYLTSFWDILDWETVALRYEEERVKLFDYTKPFEL